MTQYALYREPTPLDSTAHRQLRLTGGPDLSVASRMHACFLAVAEFMPASREFVIAFVRDQVDGRAQVQPIVILGVSEGENLFVQAASGSPWEAAYVPAYLRRYPFWTATVEGLAAPAVMFDQWWKGFSTTQGERLYDDAGQPTARLNDVLGFLEQFDGEATRTLLACTRIAELELLREMSANATLPDGRTLTLGGFLVIDEKKLQDLPDAQVIELHRNGILSLIYAHLNSLGNLQALAERKARRMGAAASAAN